MDQIKLKGYIAMKIKNRTKRKIWPLMVTVASDNESRMVYDYESLIVFKLPSINIYPISFTALLTSLQHHIQHYFRHDTVRPNWPRKVRDMNLKGQYQIQTRPRKGKLYKSLSDQQVSL